MKIVIVIAIIIIGTIILIFSQRNTEPKSSKVEVGSSENQIDLANSIFYHEDDYQQIEIVPAENFNYLIKQAENIQDFSKENFEGSGYTDMMVREENGLKLKQRGIKPKELDLFLSELPIKKYNKVSTGIRPGEMTSENTFGYGENYNGIFFDFESDSVTGIWISGLPVAANEVYTKVLNGIGNKWNLLLMDWNSLELIDLRNKEQIEKYLK
jgi:hypothetical protein